MLQQAPTILVVDDDAIVRDVVKSVLERAGYGVATANDGAAALAWLEAHRANVVLIDILMPHKEGLETIIELKREYPELLVFAMSASGARNGHDFLAIAEKFGADGIIAKPFSSEQLLSFLQARAKLPPSVAPISSLGR